MNLYTSPVAINARTFLRRLGCTRYIQRLMGTNKSYEEGFARTLLNTVRDADCVWDVGANIGKYTEKFSRLVGPAGHVVAFEPSPINFSKLTQNCTALKNVIFRSEALGDMSGKVSVLQGDDDIGATSRVSETNTTDNNGETLARVERGDALVINGCLPAPSVIKIDTEGFEAKVLKGLEGLLLRPELRVIGMEVHFGILAQHGVRHAPMEMESRLKQSGFTIRWTDPSHMIAFR